MAQASVVSNSLVTPWTVARQAPVSTGFSRQESWSGLPSPPPGDLPDPETGSMSPALQADSSPWRQCIIKEPLKLRAGLQATRGDGEGPSPWDRDQNNPGPWD